MCAVHTFTVEFAVSIIMEFRNNLQVEMYSAVDQVISWTGNNQPCIEHI